MLNSLCHVQEMGTELKTFPPARSGRDVLTTAVLRKSRAEFGASNPTGV